jgi:hypothetical protein
MKSAGSGKMKASTILLAATFSLPGYMAQADDYFITALYCNGGRP